VRTLCIDAQVIVHRVERAIENGLGVHEAGALELDVIVQ
jgi:hypothetical protein